MTEYPDTSTEKIATEFIVGTCQLLPKSCDVVFDCVYSFQTWSAVYCGSAVEFHILPLHSCIADLDALYFKNDELAFTGDFPELPSDVSCLSDSIKCYQIEPHLAYPGFVRLRYFGEVDYNWKYKKFKFNRRSFQNSYHLVDMDAVAAGLGSKHVTARTTSGPAIKLHLFSGLEVLDTVYSLWCPQWPKEATFWPKRPRRNGWPDIDTISEVVRNGCHVVYVQHRACRDDKYQWRLSFSVAEAILLQSWTKTQQITYHLLRFFMRRELIQKDCPKEDEVLCTYHIKTLMLWTCEEMPPERWNSSSVIMICCELLQKLSDWLNRGNFPNYFIPEANLFLEPSSSTIFDITQRNLNEFSDSKTLSNWFVKNYIHSYIDTYFINIDLPHLSDYCKFIYNVWSSPKIEPQFLNALFSYVLQDSNACNRRPIKSEGLREGIDARSLCLTKRFHSFTLKRMPAVKLPDNVWCFTYLVSAATCLNATYSLGSGKMSWENDKFVTFVKQHSVKPYKYVVRCQYHRYPEPTTAGSQFPFLRAQNILGHLSGSDSRSEFQLVSFLSKAFLKKSLATSFISDDSQSVIAVPATLVYLAALHFAAEDYQTVLDLCSPVLQEPPVFLQSETINAGCLFFIDDVIRIVGFCLLSRRFSEYNFMQSSKMHIFLDLRLNQ